MGRGTIRRKYSDRERADALALHDAGLTVAELSRQTGIADTTLSQWISGRNGLNKDTPRLRELSKKSLADKFEECAHLYLARAAESKAIETTSGYYAVRAANEAAVTANLLRGQPTQITQTATLALTRLQAEFPDLDDAALKAFLIRILDLPPESVQSIQIEGQIQ